MVTITLWVQEVSLWSAQGIAIYLCRMCMWFFVRQVFFFCFGNNIRMDDLFTECRGLGIPTVGIGDGGNEIGMGKLPREVILPHDL